jgi:hypothetical protein
MRNIAEVIEDLRRQGEEALSIVSVSEIRSWQKHPATVYIQKMLEADYLDYHLQWENGNFTSDTDSGTLQANAKALGAVEALSLIATSFDDIDTTKMSKAIEEDTDV